MTNREEQRKGRETAVNAQAALREKAVTVTGLSKSYSGKKVIDNLNLTIRPGQIYGLLGANGAGKSTAVECILGTRRADSGEVRILGMDPVTERRHLFEQVGVQFQEASYPDRIKVRELCEETACLYEKTADYRDLLRQFKLEDKADSMLSQLSGGQKQRVAIAGVLAMEPAILILDEATAMLDPRGRKGLMRVCRELHDRGMTVVMITHFMEEAAQADRVIVLEDGHVACDGAPQDVLVQAELLERLNLDLPFAAELSLELQRRGVPVGMHIETTTLKEELCRLLSKA